MDVNVTLRGGIFTKNIPREVQAAINGEIIRKVAERTQRQGRGLGARRNTILQDSISPLELHIGTTANFPRTRGTAWQRKNIGIIRAMAPRVGNRAAQRIADEMGGA